MNNLREIWTNRFVHYINELQRYLKYVFTGHLAIVFVFAIGAGGYAYSEWLKEVPPEFPAEWLTAILLAAVITFSPPVTLLKPADAVYFLPLEQKLGQYIKRALNWTVFSQMGLPLILFIVSLPLLEAVDETRNKFEYIGLLGFIVLLKWLYVHIEYSVRHAESRIWLDRLIRFVMAAALFTVWFSYLSYFVVLIGIGIGLYSQYRGKKKRGQPFPYNDFIETEQNRMMRFYRFANYFTDVPHLKGSVSKRSWLGMFMSSANFSKADPQFFLIVRTFFRTDDIFWLWVRLTVISCAGALFIPFTIVLFIFIGALAFATAVQLIYALQGGDEFRMDMLFPEKQHSRTAAISKLVRAVQIVQALAAAAVALLARGLTVEPLLAAAIIVIVSEATIRLTKTSSNDVYH